MKQEHFTKFEEGKTYRIFIKGVDEPMVLEYEFTSTGNKDKRMNGHWFKVGNFHGDSRIIQDEDIIKYFSDEEFLADDINAKDGLYRNVYDDIDEEVTFTPGTATCGYDCHNTLEYGFVPEVGCKVHD